MTRISNKKRNFDLYSGFSYWTPGPAGVAAMLLWLVVGSLLGSLAAGLLAAIYGTAETASYSMLVSYPIMFVPPAMYASYKSRRNAMFEPGYSLDSNHFGSLEPWLCALLAVLMTFSAAYMCDAVNSVMPEMPQQLKSLLEGMTSEGSFWINLVCVSVFAPICEEWLCRGMILRGLLNWRRKDGRRGMKPLWAILLSALIFGLIHLNPWQALPAAALGCLFGYIYWRTGSLKLTMLMHCFNNTLALAVSRIDALADAEYWTDILGARMYWVIFAALLLLLVLSVRAFQRIPLASPQGGCDEIPLSL